MVGTQARTLDSSQVLRIENYRGIVRKVDLRRREAVFDNLADVLDYASRESFGRSTFSIINVAHSVFGHERNEPRAALAFSYGFSHDGLVLANAMVVQDLETLDMLFTV